MSSKEEEASGGGGDVISALILGAFTIVAIYTTFLFCGAILAKVLEGEIRLIGSMAMAIVIPLMTAAGDNSRKEGAEGLQRISRVFIGTIIFSAATAIIVGMTMTKDVVAGLTVTPNWFLDNPEGRTGFPDLNRRWSRVMANIVATSANAAGIYNGYVPTATKPAKQVVPKKMPKSTRPRTELQTVDGFRFALNVGNSSSFLAESANLQPITVPSLVARNSRR